MVKPVRVLYSFPYRIGAGRICLTAWQQVEWTSKAGADLTVSCASIARPLSIKGTLMSTMAWGTIRMPIRLMGREKSLAWHDRMTARWLDRNHSRIDLVHAWPGASLHTMRVAKKYGIVTVLERPNAHTEYAYEAAEEEARRCGISLPPWHDHAYHQETLDRERIEYSECDFLLCPSDFVARTFIERGIQADKLLRHRYGYDKTRFYPEERSLKAAESTMLTVLYAGACEPRKGLHFLLEAWFKSDAKETCKLRICGEFVSGYAESLQKQLKNPSVEVLGHRNDLPELMRAADLFVLPSVEEGSALVTYEAMACGCVLLVSDATGAPCDHLKTGLVHRCGNTSELASHLDAMIGDREALNNMRHSGIQASSDLTWRQAGIVVKELYQHALRKHHAPE